MTSNNLLIEIGTEELPPKALKRLMLSLAENFSEGLKTAQFQFDGIEPFATPRRLGFTVKNLSSEQPTQKTERKGPSLKAAHDAEGQLTKAVTGFMRGCGAESFEDLEQVETPKGTWLVFKQEKPGAKLSDMISGLLNSSISKLPIERRMRWGASRAEFVRPIKWLIVLYGNEVLPSEVLGIGAGNVSMGHRFMSTGEVTINHADEHAEKLLAAKVVTNFSDRQAIISKQLAEIGEQEKAHVVIDPALLDEVTALVEWPVCLQGKFDKRFLNVPEEALISAMKEHQRYFHLVNDNGSLLPMFITVSNIASIRPETVITGNERVIAPRLTDAEFFFNKDKKTSLVTMAEGLKKVVFQAKLGSYFDKSARISKLAGYIAAEIGADVEAAERAGSLCKADLVSDMVSEFTDLQGLMGGFYATHGGEAESVATAIADHYKPTGAGGELPSNLVGCCVAIADKIDTITGLFGIGQPPSGSRDPFALRRQTLGIIRICVENNLSLDLDALIQKAVTNHGKDFDGSEVLNYFLDRLANWYQDLDIDGDTFNAIRYSGQAISDLSATNLRVKSLQTFRAHEKAENLIAANKRIANLAKKSDAASSEVIDVNLFSETAETELFDAIGTAKLSLESASSLEAKYLLLADLQPVIDAYFEDVMVMAEDVAVKANRLATLKQVRALFLDIADLSLLQQ